MPVVCCSSFSADIPNTYLPAAQVSGSEMLYSDVCEGSSIQSIIPWKQLFTFHDTALLPVTHYPINFVLIHWYSRHLHDPHMTLPVTCSLRTNTVQTFTATESVGLLSHLTVELSMAPEQRVAECFVWWPSTPRQLIGQHHNGQCVLHYGNCTTQRSFNQHTHTATMYSFTAVCFQFCSKSKRHLLRQHALIAPILTHPVLFTRHFPISSIDSPHSLSITPSLFHSKLKTFLFCKSFLP